MHFPADYLTRTFQDYDIKFCSIGSDNETCSGCVACTDTRCQHPVVHVSKVLAGTPDYSNPATYNCSDAECGEAPRTCWNKTCAYTEDCWPECPALYQKFLPGANMGFYVSQTFKLVELTRCCGADYCNFPNAAGTSFPLPPQSPSVANVSRLDADTFCFTYCNFPNAAARPSVNLLPALLLAFVSYCVAEADAR
jgi:hypothetical protein